MKNAICTVVETADRIKAGEKLVIAADEALLRQLPKGDWIGGTSVYFLTDGGGREERERLFVTQVDAQNCVVKHLDQADLKDFAAAQFKSGLTILLIPGFSNAHQEYAIHGPGYDGLFDQPVVGWISGVHLDDIGQVSPKVFDGTSGQAHDDGAVVMYVDAAGGQAPTVDILNLFHQDTASPTLKFASSVFSATEVFVDCKPVNLAQYITENEINTQLPLVANYSGAMINVSVQNVDLAQGKVDFYAPVVPDVEYRLAADPGPYAEVFASRLTAEGTHALSYNCILNYLYGELEGKTTGTFTGPATFGEIAYILLNQTMVYVEDAAHPKDKAA
ncbi:MAG: hypothetical protein AAFY38_12615 [Pseudomonadota bacterium]